MIEEYDFCATLHTTRSKRRVAQLFRPPTWGGRMCSWTDYEIRSAFAELVVEADSPILLHGRATDLATNAELILAPLQAAEIAYEAEGYGADGALLWNRS